MPSISLRSSTLRLGIFISTLIIAVILIFQLLWLKKVYHFEQKEFDHSVVKVIRGLYEDLDITAYNSTPLSKLVEQPSPHLYLAQINLPVNTDSLILYLQYELEDFDIFTDCHLGIYNGARGIYFYDTLLTAAGAKEKERLHLPLTKRAYDYIALYFPNREKYILSQMNFWIISSAVLLVVLILFGGSIYYFYKQKFLNETQKDFIHSFTHEFKTPVAVIGLAAEVMKDKEITGKPDKLVTYAMIVENQSHHLHNQIERLLQFAHMDSHHIHLIKEPVNINFLVREAVNNLAPLILQKKASIVYDLAAGDPKIKADKGYLNIVIINIIDNAIKYSRQPVITISTHLMVHSLLLSVKDNGIGIEKKEIKNLFKKFYRVQKGEQYAAKGFGIGLSFVRKIIAAHKGKIKVVSEPGKGSIFIMDLPLT